MTPDFLLQLAAIVVTGAFTGGAIYGALRGELKLLHARADDAKAAAARANARIDDHLETHAAG